MREKLPNRRAAEKVDFSHDGLNYTLTFSHFSDGRLAEIFLDADNVGSPVHTMAKDMATVVSIALQYGVPVREIVESLSQERNGLMRGPLGAALLEATKS